MTPDEIGKAVTKIIARQINVSENDVNPSKTLAGDLDLDSLDCVEIVIEIEDQFDLSIPDEDGEKWKTVKDIADYLGEKTKDKE